MCFGFTSYSKLPKIDRILGAGTIYMLQKFFGIILLAISVKLFTHNLAILLKEMN